MLGPIIFFAGAIETLQKSTRTTVSWFKNQDSISIQVVQSIFSCTKFLEWKIWTHSLIIRSMCRSIYVSSSHGMLCFFSLVNLSMDVTWSQFVPRPVLAELRRRHVEVELRTSESMWGFLDFLFPLGELMPVKPGWAWMSIFPTNTSVRELSMIYLEPQCPENFWRCKSVSVTPPPKQGQNSGQNKGPILGWFGRIMIMTLLELICFCQRVAVSTKKSYTQSRTVGVPETNKRNMSHRIHGTNGIFTYSYHKDQPNVGKYTIHGSLGCVLLKMSFSEFENITVRYPHVIAKRFRGKKRVGKGKFL